MHNICLTSEFDSFSISLFTANVYHILYMKEMCMEMCSNKVGGGLLLECNVCHCAAKVINFAIDVLQHSGVDS